MDVCMHIWMCVCMYACANACRRPLRSRLHLNESHCVAVAGILQCVAVCYSVLQCVAVCCSVLQCLARCCSVMKCVSLCAKSPATANLNIYRLTTTLTSPFTIYHFPFPIYKRSFLLNLPCGIVLLCVALGVNVGWIVLQCVAALY